MIQPTPLAIRVSLPVSPIPIPQSREKLYAKSRVSPASGPLFSAVAYSLPIFHLPTSPSVSPSQLHSSRSYPKISSLSTTSQRTKATIETVVDGRVSPSVESIWEFWAYSDSVLDPNPAWINFFNNGRFPNAEPHPLLRTKPREPRDFATELPQPPREPVEVPSLTGTLWRSPTRLRPPESSSTCMSHGGSCQIVGGGTRR